MKLRNSTSYQTWFLRRMVSWCCRELELPTSHVDAAQFTRCAGIFRGRAWWYGQTRGRILVRICDDQPNDFPYTGRRNSRSPEYTLADRTEAIVKVTAHELAHLTLRHRNRASKEQNTDGLALAVLASFRKDRARLLAAWSEAPQEREKVIIPLADKRAAKVRADLDRWQRKAKLAQTKIRKLKRRMAYYERRQAAATA